MKKLKLLSLLSLLLCALMIMSSCGASNGLRKLLNKDDLPEKAPAVNGIENVPELYGFDLIAHSGSLFHFSRNISENGVPTYIEHAVYNADLDLIVYSNTKRSDTTNLSIKLDNIQGHDSMPVDYFTVRLTERDATLSNPTKYTTAIYDAKGNSIISLDDNVSVQEAIDLIGLEGKLFRFNENGEAELALELSPLSKLPIVTHKVGKYYYSLETSAYTVKKIVIYDKDLNYVSDYAFPEYAYSVFATILKNGKIFAQYSVPEHDEAKKFDYTLKSSTAGKMDKYSLETLIISPTGKVKNVDCEYVLSSATSIYNYAAKNSYSGWDLEGLGVIGSAYKIDDGHRSATKKVGVTVNNFGKVSEIPMLHSSSIGQITRISEDRWAVVTSGNNTNVYLIDGNGNIIGDISNGTVYKTMITDGTAIYDLDMNRIYELKKNNMTIAGAAGDNLVLKGENSKYYVYDGTKEPICINQADNVSFEKIVNGLIICKRVDVLTGDYIIFNSNGTEVGVIEDVSTLHFNDYDTGAVLLISVTDESGKSLYYRTTRAN